jgi:hypothetical protein
LFEINLLEGKQTMRLFGREPALWIATLAALLSIAVTFNVPGLSLNQAAAITGVLTAGAGIVTAIKTRPIAVPMFTGFVGAAVILAAAYGFHVSAESVGAIQAAVTAVLVLIARGHITPVDDPRPLYPSSRPPVAMTPSPDRRSP